MLIALLDLPRVKDKVFQNYYVSQNFSAANFIAIGKQQGFFLTNIFYRLAKNWLIVCYKFKEVLSPLANPVFYVAKLLSHFATAFFRLS